MGRSNSVKVIINSHDAITSFKYDDDFVFDDKWYFVGNPTKSKNVIIKKAYDSYRAQRGRCTNTRNPAYRDYGLKGVKHLWGYQEFISWYIIEISKCEKWFDPVVSRDRDLGNYRLGNCTLLERKENARLVKITDKKRKAAYIQSQLRRKPIEVVNIKTGEIETFKSSIEASERLGKCRHYASRMIRDNLEAICDGYRFKLRYLNETS